jgi:hypothetical protein
MSEEECNHEWVYSPLVIATNPPIYRKICRKCGKKEEGGEFSVGLDEYYRVVERFRSIEK